MDCGNSRCTRVEVLPFVEAALLNGAVREFDLVPAADRPVTSSRTRSRFEHGAFKPGSAQLVCRDQSGDTRADNRYLRAAAGVGCELEGGCGAFG